MGKDILLTSDGDWILGHDGDIATVSDETGATIAQAIAVAMERNVRYSQLRQLIGADFSEFVGRPLTEDLVDQIRARIRWIVARVAPSASITLDDPLILEDTIAIRGKLHLPNGVSRKFLISASEPLTHTTYFN